jgi:hypothetical protein
MEMTKKGMPYLLLASVALIAWVSCSPAFYSVKGVSPSQNLAIVQGCPEIGMSTAQLQTLAELNDMRMEINSAGSLASLHLRRSDLKLQAELAEDTVRGWRVIGEPTPELAKPTAIWFRQGHRGFRKRVRAYVFSQRLSSVRAYAVYRSCAVAGTTPADLRASWGEPARQIISMAADTTRLIYGYGVEGQYVEFIFVSDSLVLMREQH